MLERILTEPYLRAHIDATISISALDSKLETVETDVYAALNTALVDAHCAVSSFEVTTDYEEEAQKGHVYIEISFRVDDTHDTRIEQINGAIRQLGQDPRLGEDAEIKITVDSQV